MHEGLLVRPADVYVGRSKYYFCVTDLIRKNVESAFFVPKYGCWRWHVLLPNVYLISQKTDLNWHFYEGKLNELNGFALASEEMTFSLQLASRSSKCWRVFNTEYSLIWFGWKDRQRDHFLRLDVNKDLDRESGVRERERARERERERERDGERERKQEKQ